MMQIVFHLAASACVFQLHLAALASLKGDVVELNKRLQQTERERDLLEKKLAKAQVSDFFIVLKRGLLLLLL